MGSKKSKGRRGGARRGAGRKAGSLPPDLAEKLAEIPPVDNPLHLARWYTTALALLSAARLRGGKVSAIDKLAKEIRANAAAAGKVIPHDIQFAAARILSDDEDELASDGGPEEEERVAGGAAARADA